MGRERRRRNRRATAQTADGTPQAAAAVHEGGPASTAMRPQVRSDRVIERESTSMVREMKRVGLVSVVCFGMLAVLVVVDRLQ
jgi:hypothetical protein